MPGRAKWRALYLRRNGGRPNCRPQENSRLPDVDTARCPLSLCLSAETDTNQTADPKSNSGSAEPNSDLAKPRKYDAAAGKQACTCADRKQGDTTRSDADDDRQTPRQEQEAYDGKDCADRKQAKGRSCRSRG